MKLVKLNDARQYAVTDTCNILEYKLDDIDINCDIATINGRYPKEGYCSNEKCKELIYVIKGSGIINIMNRESIKFSEGDVILIDKGEIYYWDADCIALMPCTPAWYPEQHKILEE